MSTLTRQLVDAWGTRTAQAIGAVIVLSFAGYYLLLDAGTFALAGGAVFLATGVLMLYDLLVE
ncbi:hypothetical protein C491_04956 [Natronococcus amylolyticus DSM 10524]|uniref:Uncharacterized protein n=1 Tax=Natronococcus amylolyticus DSM 10524 TaxID=1227497 RepID=L9XD98_9EURY|nr:hypothetical protein [Natronococcus amylolyticus]ELY59689.1 hypothetical protein C491_04956 [Natronococcus amylolyticus DSM 10524]